MNQPRSTPTTMTKKFTKKGKQKRREELLHSDTEFSDFDEQANSNEMDRLFEMGFVSLEEVPTFDREAGKRRLAAEDAMEVLPEADASVVTLNGETYEYDPNLSDFESAEAEALVEAEAEEAVEEPVKERKSEKAKPKRIVNGWTVTEVSEPQKRVKVDAEVKTDTKTEAEAETKTEKTEKTEKKKQEQKDSKESQLSKEKQQPQKPVEQVVVPTPVGENELMEWRQFGLHDNLLSALKDGNFATPMPIQLATLKSLFTEKSRNLMASAPTGSGKTLAFGLPILDYIYKQPLVESSNKQSSVESTEDETPAHKLTALIIVPTRELAIQIERHLKLLAKYNTNQNRKVRIATVIGGMSAEKQDRQLATRPDIVIATPGRLSEAMEFDFATRKMILATRFLVLDEADRLVQAGHFKELDEILEKICNTPRSDRQILLFSATLDASRDKKSPFVKLITRLQLDRTRGVKEVAVIDLAGRPSTLEEWQCPCPSQLEKDPLVWYFLEDLRKSDSQGKFGRVLMFVNAIEAIRRLQPLFTLLGIPVLGLHAQMQQRQRLKNLDRFKSADECLLIASDVAARGLDIQGIQHVIHYHLPKNKETYVHRCGRTARASKSGASLAIFAPEERGLAERCGLLGGMARFSVDDAFIASKIMPAIKLARKIENLQHTDRSCRAQVTWAERAAEELGVILDEDNDPSLRYRQERERQGLQSKSVKKEIDLATKQLKSMLQTISEEF